MAEILKRGKLEKPEILTCPKCGCEFIPENKEKRQVDYNLWVTDCPDCGHPFVKCNNPYKSKASQDNEHRDKLIQSIVEYMESTEFGEGRILGKKRKFSHWRF